MNKCDKLTRNLSFNWIDKRYIFSKGEKKKKKKKIPSENGISKP